VGEEERMTMAVLVLVLVIEKKAIDRIVEVDKKDASPR
jgi:hypothetical protein